MTLTESSWKLNGRASRRQTALRGSGRVFRLLANLSSIQAASGPTDLVAAARPLVGGPEEEPVCGAARFRPTLQELCGVQGKKLVGARWLDLPALRMGARRVMINLDVYNTLNANPVLQYNNNFSRDASGNPVAALNVDIDAEGRTVGLF